MGDYTVDKRYREFRNLRNQLKETYKELDLKEFPRKKLFSSLKQSTIDERIRQLNQFLTVAFQHYLTASKEYRLLEFLEIDSEFRKKGIFDYFREQANSTVTLWEQHADICKDVNLKPNSDSESKMMEILQKLNAFTESATNSFEKMRNFYFRQQPVLSKAFIPLILFGEAQLKGLIEVSLRVSKEDSHYVCCQGLKLLLELMDIQKNPSAQAFIDVYTSTTFQELKKFNFRGHILNKQQRDCRILASRFLKIYIDAHEKTLSKVTRQLFLDDKSFEEYVRVVKVQNVPRQLLNKVLLDLLAEEEHSGGGSGGNGNQHLQSMATNDKMRPNSVMRGSHQLRSDDDFRERFMFKRESVLDKESNTFFEPFEPQSQVSSDIRDLKDAVNDPYIDWLYIYQHPTCDVSLARSSYPDHFIRIKISLPLSLADSQQILTLNRSDWDSHLIELGTIGKDDRQRVVGRETLRFTRYSGERMLTFLFSSSIINEVDTVYWMIEAVDFPQYKPSPNEDMGKWQKCIKFREIKMTSESSVKGDSYESYEEGEQADEEIDRSVESGGHLTEITIMIRCCDNNSMVFVSPFLLNDDKSMVEKFVNFVQNVKKQQANQGLQSTYDQSLTSSSVMSLSYHTPLKQQVKGGGGDDSALSLEQRMNLQSKPN